MSLFVVGLLAYTWLLPLERQSVPGVSRRLAIAALVGLASAQATRVDPLAHFHEIARTQLAAEAERTLAARRVPLLVWTSFGLPPGEITLGVPMLPSSCSATRARPFHLHIRPTE